MASPIVSHHSFPDNIPKRAEQPSLWELWWTALQLVRPAFSHVRTFLWFAVAVAGLTLRTELFGVTSIVRVLRLTSCTYDRLLKCFHSSAIDLDRLCASWTSAVMRLFMNPVRINGRLVLVGDGIKAPKRGKKMPAVKLLHQQSSEDNTKAEWIMGHSLQAVSLLVRAADSVFAVPLVMRIHEGLVWSNRDRRTLLDKMLALLHTLAVPEPVYFVADAFYAAGKMIDGLHSHGGDLITRVKSNAVAYTPYRSHEPRKRGRPRLYGERIALASLLDDLTQMMSMPSPVYGEHSVTLHYRVANLLWRPVGRIVRFVAVSHPTRGPVILLCSDVDLEATEIIRAYGLRFKIEYGFKQIVHLVGAFSYRFWMKRMTPLRRWAGDQYMHHQSLAYRNAVKRKIHAYHVFLQAAVVAQGLLQYLSSAAPTLVWNAFGSWLRTIRPGVPPSEFVAANALRNRLTDFLRGYAATNTFAKFIAERQTLGEIDESRLAA